MSRKKNNIMYKTEVHNILFNPKPINPKSTFKNENEILNYLNSSEIKDDTKITIRGGRHNHEAYCAQNGKIVIDLGNLKNYSYSKEKKTAIAGAGLTNLEIIYLQSLCDKTRILSTGECSSVGTAGYTLGGGWHLFCRQNGLSVDSVISIKVIRLKKESLDNEKWELVNLNWHSNRDELKMILGSGGGNFCIVTEIEYQTFELKDVYDVTWEDNCDKDDVKLLKKAINDWLTFQTKVKGKNFTSIVRFIKKEKSVGFRILCRCNSEELSKVIFKIKEIKRFIGSKRKVIISSYSPYSIPELLKFEEELKNLLPPNITSNFLSKNDIFSESISKYYNTISNISLDKIEEYIGTAFFYELSHKVDAPIGSANNYSCTEPRKHKVTSTFIKNNYSNKDALKNLLDYLVNSPFIKETYSICTIHTVGGKSGELDTSYAFKDKDFLIQIQSWLPKDFNDKEVEDNMVNWVNEFREQLMKTKLFEGAFINFLNDEIPVKDYYKEKYQQLVKMVDPHNKIDSSPLSKINNK